MSSPCSNCGSDFRVCKESDCDIYNGKYVEQRTGHWIVTIEDWKNWTCSECGFQKRTDIHVDLGYDYCPKCGSYNGGNKSMMERKADD